MTKGDFVSLFLFLSLFISSFPSLNFFNFSGERGREGGIVRLLSRTDREEFFVFHKFPSHDEAEAAAVPPRAEEAREGKRARVKDRQPRG